MTTVQVPKWFVRSLPRFQVHGRQPFYEILVSAVRQLNGRVTALPQGGEEPP